MNEDLANIIEVVDVRGILVVCEKSQWDRHIILLHPDVQEEVVKNTIKRAGNNIPKRREYQKGCIFR